MRRCFLSSFTRLWTTSNNHRANSIFHRDNTIHVPRIPLRRPLFDTYRSEVAIIDSWFTQLRDSKQRIAITPFAERQLRIARAKPGKCYYSGRWFPHEKSRPIGVTAPPFAAPLLSRTFHAPNDYYLFTRARLTCSLDTVCTAGSENTRQLTFAIFDERDIIR